MSLKERIAVLQQRNADDAAPAAAVGHAAPLRAKIAQFESKGGVPLPRPGASFGINAPPVVDRAQPKRGELYGNRMKPVWVPSAGRARAAPRGARAREERGHVREESGSGREDLMVDQFPSPPDSPPAAPSADSDSEPPSPTSTVCPESNDAEQDLEATDSMAPENDHEDVEEGQEVVVDEVVDTISEDPVISPLPSPPAVPTVPLLPTSPEQEASPPHIPADLPEVLQHPSSPSFLPSPPLSSVDPAEPDDSPEATALREPDPEYGTVVLNRTQHRQGQSFSSVVYGRVREPTRHEKDLPPTPKLKPKPKPLNLGHASARDSTGDLAALMKDSVTLERRLAAGLLPTETPRRRLPPVNKEMPAAPAPVSSESQLDIAPAPPESAKGKQTLFRNPLALVRKHKEDAPATYDAESTAPVSKWYPEPAPTPFSGWRKLASTSRLASGGSRKLDHSVHTPRTLISS